MYNECVYDVYAVCMMHIYVYIYMCCVCAYTPLCACVCANAVTCMLRCSCGGQKIIVGVFPCLALCLRPELNVILLLYMPSLMASKFPGFSCLYLRCLLRSTEIKDDLIHVQHILGFHSGVSKLDHHNYSVSKLFLLLL